MIILLTILIILAFFFLLYCFIKLLTRRKDIVYSSKRNQPLEYTTEDITLKGRPDYIKREEGNYVPYEYKSLKIKAKDAYLDHKLQLACYMRLIEKSYRIRPDYGVITYGNKRNFKVDNTIGLQKELDRRINRLKELKTNRAKPTRNHYIRLKCAACRHNPTCAERL